jgi:deoxyribodipyrimidine photolyase-related protein
MQSSKLFIILGNQLFRPHHINKYKSDHVFFMAEDYGLCTYEKHHKQKILLFLSSMRSYAEEIKNNGCELIYHKINHESFKQDYINKIKDAINSKNIKEITSFEIEDKRFEKILLNFFEKEKIKWNILQTPMFLNTRSEFEEHINDSKKILMANFYKKTRRKLNILISEDGKPEGGKWSFDSENRKKIPKEILIPPLPKIRQTQHTKDLKPIIEKIFAQHPGNTSDFWFATTHSDVTKLVNFFIKKKLNLFGDYEDAVSQQDNILFHSALSPYLNLGLITPESLVENILVFYKKNHVNFNSLEGYIRQVIGWREFTRGIYQNFNLDMESSNFFKHNRRMKESWYEGNTGLPPLDYAINNASVYGWSHHIERLMILANIMNLCEVKPIYVYKWFMEMFVDSSEWVMVPNVYGMGLYSDGGIFATKPYICGSNYFLKMMDFKKGDWCNTMDGLYWRFINKNRDFFSSNPRLSMMVSIFDKMKPERKQLILLQAENFITKNTFI